MPDEPMSLLEAVESGDVLEMLKAQRRMIAASLMTAADNTRPQFNNELNKLHGLIAAEEARLAAASEEASQSGNAPADEKFDPAAI